MRFEKATYENFTEDKYLLSNPDVSDAIKSGQFESGYDHFRLCGHLEDRYQKVTLQKNDPLAIVHIPKCAGTSLRIEVDSICPSIYKGQKYSVRGKKKALVPRHSKEKTLESESQTWTLKELSEARDLHDCIMGHISLIHFWKAGFRDFVLIVREPRIRILSEWIFLTSNREYDETLMKRGVFNTKTYFSRYAKISSNNKINSLLSLDLVFDSNIQSFNLSCYWNDEIPRLMKENFGQEAKNIRANESSPQMRDIDYRILDSLHELTEGDSKALNRLKNAGLLSPRSEDQMEEEFQQYLKKNFNYVRRLL